MKKTGNDYGVIQVSKESMLLRLLLTYWGRRLCILKVVIVKTIILPLNHHHVMMDKWLYYCLDKYDTQTRWTLGSILHYPKLTVMRGVEHTMSLFFNDVSKIPIVNQMIYAHNMIYNIFGFGIYHNPNSIFKSKSKDLYLNMELGL